MPADASKPAEPYVVRDKRRLEDDAEQPVAPVVDVAKLQEQLKQAEDRSLRTLAEVENTKKRLQREKDDFAKYAAEAVLRELLPILDGLDQALVAVDTGSDPEAITKGLH